MNLEIFYSLKPKVTQVSGCSTNEKSNRLQRTFLSNLFILIILNLLVKPLWVLGIDVMVQDQLGPTVYGNYFALVNFAFLFTVILDFGINNYNNRKISRDPGSVSKTLVESGFLKGALGIVFSLCVGLCSYLMSFNSEEIGLLRLISLMLFLQSFLVFLRSNLSGIQWYKADVLVSVLDKSLMIIIVWLMLKGFLFDELFDIKHFIIAQSCAYVIAILVVIGLLIYKIKHFQVIIKWSRLIQILRESAPFALLTFLMLVYFKVDAVMIKQMLHDGDTQTGYYAQAYKLLEAAVMFAFLFSSLLLPMFSRMLAANESVRNLVSLSSKMMLIPSWVFVVIMVFYGKDFLEVMYSAGTSESAFIFPVLITTLLPLGASYIYGTLITAQGDLKFLNQISVIAILVNVILNYVLIQQMGILGAAIATLATQSLVSVVQWIKATKQHGLNFDTASLVKSVSFGALTVLCALGVSMSSIDWKIQVICISISGVILAFGLKLLSVKSIKKVLTS